jgi:hypothetical protein
VQALLAALSMLALTSQDAGFADPAGGARAVHGPKSVVRRTDG